jgi:hypothetical protein
MDGRYETVYPKYIFDSYTEFYFGRHGWRFFLDKYPHDMILIKKSANVYPLLLRQENWWEAYRDFGSALFIRCGR